MNEFCPYRSASEFSEDAYAPDFDNLPDAGDQ
jgi:hypothetical protein